MALSQLSAKRVAFSGASRTRVVTHASTSLPAQYKAVKPVADRVFVKVDKEETKTQGGVLLPTGAQKKPNAGAVVAVGDAKFLKIGDHVVYSKYAGTDLSIGNDEHVLLKEDDVIGVLSSSSEEIEQLQPLGDRVLIKRAKAESTTSGGVLLAAESVDKPSLGTVVAVGAGKAPEEEGAEIVKPNVAIGSTVLYSKYSGTEFEGAEDNLFIVVRESDILASLS